MIFNFGHFKMSVFALKPKALKGSLPSFTQNEQKILLICRYGCVCSFEHGNIYTATFRLCKTLPLALAHFGTAFLVFCGLVKFELRKFMGPCFQPVSGASALLGGSFIKVDDRNKAPAAFWSYTPLFHRYTNICFWLLLCKLDEHNFLTLLLYSNQLYSCLRQPLERKQTHFTQPLFNCFSVWLSACNLWRLEFVSLPCV